MLVPAAELDRPCSAGVINNARSSGVHVPVSLLVELSPGREFGTRLRPYLADGWG